MPLKKIDSVDVIMPFHRVDRFFYEALECLEQTMGVDLRIILVDDRPTPKNEFILKSKFETVVVDTNGLGYAGAIARGCAEIKSEYVAFHDSDDLSSPKRIALQIENLTKNQADLSICGMIKIGTNGRPKKITSRELILKDDFTLPLLIGSHGANSTWVLNSKTVLSGLFYHQIESLDWGTALKKFKSLKISFLDSNLYYYRSHKDQMTRSIDYQKSIEEEIYPLWLDVNNNYHLPSVNSNQFGAICYPYSAAKWSKETSEWAKAFLDQIEVKHFTEKANFESIIGARILQNFRKHKRIYISKFEVKCILRFVKRIFLHSFYNHIKYHSGG